jgi:hypothetical protein
MPRSGSGGRNRTRRLTHRYEQITLPPMSKRMQVLISEKEFRLMKEIARRRGLTLAEWVRQTLRGACRQEPLGDPDVKLARVRAALRHEFPAPDIDQMLAEIARGYRTGSDE